MNNKLTTEIKGSIADTLFITLYAKAVETKNKNPLIVDHTACELVDKLDYNFSKYKNKKASSVGVAIRASHFDNIVKLFIEKHQKPVVVIIGCGLDARVQRIGNIAEKAVFYSLDIEEAIKLRKQLFLCHPNEYLISGSMLETNWMDDLKAKHPDGSFIFIIEGVLMYFDESGNKQVFKALAERFSGAEIHFDMLNKWMSNKTSIHDTVSKTNATFKFGIDDEKEIEKWHPELKHMRTYLFNEFKGWTRMGFILSSLMRLLPVFKKSSRILAYKIN